MILLCLLPALLLGQYAEEEKQTPPPGTETPAPRVTGVKYRWPLNINNGYSSAFQEFRGGHFHAGLDFRTYQKTGYPVYALSDGVIVKVRMVKRGSGRGLYLKHDDGNTSIYFHLERFEKNIENLAKRVQKLQGKKYFGNYWLKKPLRYKRGQVIGYSGESGSGFAHLHVEIRDRHQFALNPFKLITFSKPDKNRPVIRGILLRNVNRALVNGGIDERYLRFKKLKRGVYTLSRPVIVTGPFDAVLHAHDISDTGRHCAPYLISASVGAHDYFELPFERFQWDDNNQLGFVYDMYRSTSGTYYYNLFTQPGNTLERNNVPLQGVLEGLGPGEHRLTIRVRDNFNNESVATVPFIKLPEPRLQVGGCRAVPGEIHLDIESMSARDADDIAIRLKNKDEKTLYSGDFPHRFLEQKKGFTIKGSFPRVAFIDFIFKKKGVTYYTSRFPVDDRWLAGLTDIEYETFINRDEVYLKVKKPFLSPANIRLTVIQGQARQTLEPHPGGDFITFHFKPFNTVNDVLLNFSLFQEGRKVVEIQKKLVLLYLRKGEKQVLKYEEFAAVFDPKSVYEPKAMRLEERNYKSSYPIESRQISLAPYFFPFLDLVYYTFKKDLPKPGQVGIFQYSRKNKSWYYRYTTYDRASRTFKTKLRSSGEFALMRDVFPPRITFLKVHTQYRKKLGRLVVKITDKGKGVNDSRLKVTLNGRAVDCEYDPDWRTVVIEDLKAAGTGKNTLTVSISDHAGHHVSKSMGFYLK